MTGQPGPEGVDEPAFASEPAELESLVDQITGFIEEQTTATDRGGVVAGLAGDLSSAVAAMLAVRAVGADRVLGLLTDPAPSSGDITAELVAKGLRIEYEPVEVPAARSLLRELPAGIDDPEEAGRARERALERLRMACVFYVADVRDHLVIGTGNRTERLLGTVTRFGAGEGDIQPLGDLYRTEVGNLANHIGIPDGVRDPAPSFLDDVEPRVVDAVLYRLIDEDAGIEQTAAALDVDDAVVRMLAERHVATRRTRLPPATPRTWSSDRYDRFHEIELRFGDAD